MDQIIVFGTLFLALVGFVWGRIRYDFIALTALFAVTIFGIIPPDKAFIGFSNAAVITVVAVMIISQGMLASGMIDVVARWLQKAGDRLFLQILALCSITAIASAFINNVGALAIMMPVAIKLARKSGNAPSSILMPLAFSSLMGGMISLIGTPPNIIISSMRQDLTGSGFRIFSFAPVGLTISLVGINFMAFIGWRFIPKRQSEKDEGELFQIEDYITEVQITEESPLIGQSIAELRDSKDFEINILGMIRQNLRIHIPSPAELIAEGDILILEAEMENLKEFIDLSKTKLIGERKFRSDAPGSEDISLREVIVLEGSRLIRRTAAGLHLRSRYGVNLLAIARGQRKMIKRMDHIKFMPGDVLLMQGRRDLLNDSIVNLGCMPISSDEPRLGNPRRIVSALFIFGSAMLSVLTGFLQVQIAFTLAALLFVLTGIISFREVYDKINWPIIVLLGAMIPVGLALEISGGADTIAVQILALGESLPLWQMLAIVMILTMILSDVVNNAATAVLMAPIGIKLAQGMGVSPDVFLMTIAVGASSAFLTPIGHQSNTLVMSPGGYKFSDYWRLGLPIEILIVAISIPIILHYWA